MHSLILEEPAPVLGRLTRQGPLLLVLRGLGAEPGQLLSLCDQFPDVALVHLPPGDGPADFAAVFDAVLDRLEYSEAVVLGLSVGALAALHMRHPSVKRLILVDPPLETANLWPLPGRPAYLNGPDYRPVLAGLKVPAIALVGAVPLEPERPIEALPSLVSEASRAALGSTPGLRSLIIEGAGHNVPKSAPQHLFGAIRYSLREVSPAPA